MNVDTFEDIKYRFDSMNQQTKFRKCNQLILGTREKQREGERNKNVQRERSLTHSFISLIPFLEIFSLSLALTNLI